MKFHANQHTDSRNNSVRVPLSHSTQPATWMYL